MISQWATGSSSRSMFGVVNLCTLHMLTPAVPFVTLIITMHLFRQRLPWFMPRKIPQTPAFAGWGQSGGQHFTYLCHSSPVQSLSCQWEKTGAFRDDSSPQRRMRCLNWVGWIALQQSLSVSRERAQTRHLSCRQLGWGGMNVIPQTKLETTACCCHNFNSFMRMVSLRKKFVFLNCFNTTQFFPGLWARWLPNTPKAILPLLYRDFSLIPLASAWIRSCGWRSRISSLSLWTRQRTT